MVEALITPKMVSWARERVNWTPEKLAKKMYVSTEKINAWENEAKLEHPSFRQAIELSNKLHIPLGYLYLNTPPTETVPLPDLRTTANRLLEKPSPEFIDTLYDAYRKQQWYRDYLQNEGFPRLEFAGKYKITDDLETIASDIQNTLGINDDLRKSSLNWDSFLTSLVYHTEQSRILVLRNGVVGNNAYRKLDINEFRGFAICDEIAPLVFINARDYKTAQIFTLIHEIAHIWIGKSGVSNLNFRLKDTQQSHTIDRLCDSIAGEVLVPRNQFIPKWNANQTISNNSNHLASDFKVSAFVILRRAYNLDLITKDDFISNYDELLTKIKPKSKEGGGDFHKLLKARNSYTLMSTLIMGLADGSVSPKEASLLLNIRPSSLKGVEDSFT
jgi:Zn-dependent peptidase ImmA (M78 family)/DNA-binding XRE family transcriptional regulator